MDLQKNEQDSRKTVQLLFLIAVGVMLFPFVLIDGLFPGWGYWLAEKYYAVPCLLFFGSALTQRLTPTAKRSVLLAAVAVLWFAAAQLRHHFTGMGVRNFGLFATVYLLAYPFASVTRDGRENVGMKWIARIYVAFSLLLVLLCGMLLLDVLPEFLFDIVILDGVRAALFWHPNGTGAVLMLGVGFTLTFLAQAKNKRDICILSVLVALQFCVLVLTNSRTSILMTCALLGGTLFFKFWKGGWKQFVVMAVAAVAAIAVLFAAYTAIFDLHTEIQVNKLIAQQEAAQKAAEEAAAAQEAAVEETQAAVEQIPETAPPASAEPEKQKPTTQHLYINPETGEATIWGVGSSGQNDLSTDIKHFNGRFSIWSAALLALRENPETFVWGTEYVSAEIISRCGIHTAVNAHNSWLQVWMLLGTPAFLIAMAYTLIALWNIWTLVWRKNVELWKKVVALMVVCVIGASMLEAYLFAGEMPTYFVNFIFFLSTGYLVQWNRIARGKEE